MAKKTDNSYFAEKVKLRSDNLPAVDPVRVLDMYHGNGHIWREVARLTGRRIDVLGIDKKPGMTKIYLRGDNRKYRLDYDRFDLIDLDAYGVPYEQLETLFAGARKPKGVFATFIQSVFGRQPVEFLETLGYSSAMIDKVPTLFSLHGQQKMKDYLSLRGVRSVKIYHAEHKRKNYIFFRIEPREAVPKNDL